MRETLYIHYFLGVPTVRVLIAHNQPLLREALTALCHTLPTVSVVSQVGTGAEAIEAAGRLKPDVAFLDADLTDLVATKVVIDIHERAGATRCAILSLTKDPKMVLHALRAGVSGFLLTSDTASEFTRALHAILNGCVYVSPQIEGTSLFSSARRKHSIDCDPIETLSNREHQVFTLLMEGCRSKEVAARLGISPKTVHTYRASLMKKLNVDDLASLVKLGIRQQFTAA